MSDSTPSTTLTAHPKLLFLLCAALLVGLYVLRAAQQFDLGFPLDDAWIHQVYARNLAEHGEWSFVQGEASAASTAPLYTVLLALGHLLGLSPFLWAHGLGVLALSWAAIMGAALGGQLFPGQRYVPFLTGLALLFSWHLVWAAAAGMETILFMALSLILLHLSLRHLHDLPGAALWGNALLLGLVGGLLTLTRPEGLGLLGLAGLLVWLAVGWQQARRYLAWTLLCSLLWLLIVTPYVLWNYNLTGDLLPATADAKIVQHAPLRELPLTTRYAQLLLAILVGAQFLGLPGLFYALSAILQRLGQNRRLLLCLLPLLWALAHLTLFALRLPASYQHGRYVMPALPPLLLYMVGGWLALVLRYRRNALQRVLLRSGLLAFALSFPSFIWLGASAYAEDVSVIESEMVDVAQWVAAHVPPQELLVVHDIGAIGYYAPRPILDFAGLVTPELVPILNDPPALMRYICQQDAHWLMALPDQRRRLMEDGDPRLQVVYESPYDIMPQSYGESSEAWKMRLYRLDCSA